MNDKWSETEKNMKTKNLLFLLLCAMLFALCFSADAQQPTKVPRIGYLTYCLPFRYLGPHRGIPAGAARAWVRGGKKHCH